MSLVTNIINVLYAHALPQAAHLISLKLKFFISHKHGTQVIMGASNDGKSAFQECESKIISKIERLKHLTWTLRRKVLICSTMLILVRIPVLFYV